MFCVVPSDDLKYFHDMNMHLHHVTTEGNGIVDGVCFNSHSCSLLQPLLVLLLCVTSVGCDSISDNHNDSWDTHTALHFIYGNTLLNSIRSAGSMNCTLYPFHFACHVHQSGFVSICGQVELPKHISPILDHSYPAVLSCGTNIQPINDANNDAYECFEVSVVDTCFLMNQQQCNSRLE